MSSKLLLLFMGTFLLVQSSFGKALSSSEESENIVEPTFQPDLKYEIETPGEKLVYYVLAQMSKVSESGLEYGKKILQNVIAEISAQDEKNEEITARLEEYSNLVAEIEKLQTDGNSDEYIDKMELMAELVYLIYKANITLIEKPSSIDELFEESLQKNGLSDVHQHINKKFVEVFGNEFYETADRILKSATIEEWPEKTEIQDWLEKFKIENDVEKKNELLEQFFDFYQ